MPQTTCLLMPVELIEKIIFETWSSPLSADERIHFMTTSLLVNKIWADVFNRFSFKNVHILSASYLEQYLRILREDSPILGKEFRSLPDQLCESISINIENTPPHPDFVPGEEEPPMGKVLSDMLYTLHSIPYLPNLRKITITYQNTGFNDLFDNLRLIAFPSQVTDLEINFIADSSTPSWVADALREKHTRYGSMSWSLPSIERLSFFGASDAFVADMISCCPNADMYTLSYAVDIGSAGPVTCNDSTSSSVSVDHAEKVDAARMPEEASEVSPGAEHGGFVSFPGGVWEHFGFTKSMVVDLVRIQCH
jgi:hypothetical protein